KGHFRPVFIQSAAVLKAVKARAWKRRSAPSMAERRPALTASARVGIGNLWSGRKKACSAVEQKKGLKRESKSARFLHSWPRLENERMLAAKVEQKNGMTKDDRNGVMPPFLALPEGARVRADMVTDRARSAHAPKRPAASAVP